MRRVIQIAIATFLPGVVIAEPKQPCYVCVAERAAESAAFRGIRYSLIETRSIGVKRSPVITIWEFPPLPAISTSLGTAISSLVAANYTSTLDFNVDGSWLFKSENRVAGNVALMRDSDGDGVFDAHGAAGKFCHIPFGSELVEVVYGRVLPRVEAQEHLATAPPNYELSAGETLFPSGRNFVLENGRWAVVTVLGSKRQLDFAKDSAFTLPHVERTSPQKTSVKLLNKVSEKISKLDWHKSNIPRYVQAEIAVSETRVGETMAIEFTTIAGNKFEAKLLADGFVKEWKFADGVSYLRSVRSDNQSRAVTGVVFGIGDYEYFDANADGIIDSFRNVDLDEWVIIASALIRVAKPIGGQILLREYKSLDGNVGYSLMDDGLWKTSGEIKECP